MRWCSALPCCEGRGTHWCGICRGGSGVVMVTTARDGGVTVQAPRRRPHGRRIGAQRGLLHAKRWMSRNDAGMVAVHETMPRRHDVAGHMGDACIAHSAPLPRTPHWCAVSRDGGAVHWCEASCDDASRAVVARGRTRTFLRGHAERDVGVRYRVASSACGLSNTSRATNSRFQVASPKVTSLPLARLKYRCMSCSQVKPMPPWIWMPSPLTMR